MSTTTEQAPPATNGRPERRRGRAQHGLQPLPQGARWTPALYATHAAGTVHRGPDPRRPA